MGKKFPRRFRQGMLILAMLLIGMAPDWTLQSAGAETPAISTSAPAVKTFQLYATDGYLTLPDGKQVYVWGYSSTNEKGTASFPAPTLEVNEGDRVEVTLTNIGPKKQGIKRLAHTIHWHGLDTDQANDGVPHTSPAIQVGESFKYQFTADHAGTYFYHCHVDTIEHLQMGMYGAFIVKAKDGANQAWTGGPSFDKEYVFVLNEIDPVWHQAVENGTAYDRTNFHPTYWTINGKAFPDTENDPATMIEGTVGETVLIRIVNSGYQPHSFHMHGYHFQVIASDGRPLPEPLTKDTILIGPGERYDLLVTFDKDGMFPFHSHSVVDNTNNGVYPGGMHTMIEVAEPSTQPVMTSIRLKVGRGVAIVDGSMITLAAAPFVQTGAAYVPLRFIADRTNATVKWDERTKSVLYRNGKSSIQLWLNSRQVKVDGKMTNIAAPLKVIKNTAMVPVSFVTDQLGAKTVTDKASGEWVLTIPVAKAAPSAAESGSGAHTGHDAGSGDTGGGMTTPSAGDDPLTVTISNSAFNPQKLTVKKGETVKWVNMDTQIHTVIDLGSAFDSKNLTQNGVFTHTFNETGTYTYYCSTHPSMQAEIIVSE